MKLMDKRFLILFFAIANVVVASAQAVFSVEEISRTDYIKAEKECSRYNVIPADSITDNEIVNLVLKESQTKFEQLDSATRQEIYYLIDEEEFGFNKRQSLYLAELKLYGFAIPNDPFEDSVWWFDSESGKYIGRSAFPTAINTNGIFVSQKGYDCDWGLNLTFFRRDGNVIYELESYKNRRYNGETVVYQPEDDKYPHIFWHNNNILYLTTYDILRREDVYLRIKIQQSVRN